MPITRRQFYQGASAAAPAAAAGFYWFTPWTMQVVEPAIAQPAPAGTVPMLALMKPGELPDIVTGSKDAPVTIVEYASMTCPHCAHFDVTTFPELKKRYIDTGKVRYIFREFPLDALALDGAMLARCLSQDDSSKYLAMIDVLFRQQANWALRYPEGMQHPGLQSKGLLALAKQAGFSEQTYKACLANQQIQKGILDGLQRAGNDFKVRSTPTFFINGTMYVGALTIEEISKPIDEQLKGK